MRSSGVEGFMTSRLPFLVGLVVLLGAGIVHGVWTGRWRPSREVADAAARLDALPDDVGAWKGEPYEQDPEELRLTGAAGHWSRTFTDPATGEKVLVVLLCGKGTHMVVHRPEHCYRSVGYEPDAPPVHALVEPAGRPAAEFWTGGFTREEASGPAFLRIFWAWRGAGGPPSVGWSAPSSPRLAFARQGALYKLYVIRASARAGAPAREPCVELLKLLLPILDDALSPT
jgi:hypothetical protein